MSGTVLLLDFEKRPPSPAVASCVGTDSVCSSVTVFLIAQLPVLHRPDPAPALDGALEEDLLVGAVHHSLSEITQFRYVASIHAEVCGDNRIHRISSEHFNGNSSRQCPRQNNRLFGRFRHQILYCLRVAHAVRHDQIDVLCAERFRRFPEFFCRAVR